MRFNKRGLREFNTFKVELVKKGVTSGGSRFSFAYKRTLPINVKFKKLVSTIKSNSGRSSNGSMIM